MRTTLLALLAIPLLTPILLPTLLATFLASILVRTRSVVSAPDRPALRQVWVPAVFRPKKSKQKGELKQLGPGSLSREEVGPKSWESIF
jgi:hypothetical protein